MIGNETEPDTNRGQVGIGTLIVFIAMVLVAAIAAGVLINTAGFLQTQAEDTGTESTEQVADNLNVITETGNVSAGDKINELRIGVQPASGSDNINLAELTLQYVSDNEFANVVVGPSGTDDDDNVESATGDTNPDDVGLDDTGEEHYVVDVITAEQEGDIVMTDGADRYEIVVPLNDGLEATDYPVYDDGDDVSGDFSPGDGSGAELADQGDLASLSEGSEVEVTITTQVGAQTVAFMQVPDSLAGSDAGSSVNL